MPPAINRRSVCLFGFLFRHFDLVSIPVDPHEVRQLMEHQERRRRRWVKVQENIADLSRLRLSLPRRNFSSMGHHGIRGVVLKVISPSIGPSFAEINSLFPSRFNCPPNGTDCFDSQYRNQGDNAVCSSCRRAPMSSSLLFRSISGLRQAR